MKKILGLDLGTSSIGWALVHEAESAEEKSQIIKLGVRVNPLTVDENLNFGKGKSIETNAVRRMKRSMHRNLQRYKLRREQLIKLLKQHHFITDSTLLSEHSNQSTFETYRLRAKAVTEKISLEEFARVLLMINKKRGYKSSRKAKGDEDGKLIDGMEIAKILYNDQLTPGQLCLQILKQGRKSLPDFYRSDLQAEFNRIWEVQSQFYPSMLTPQVKEEVSGKNKSQTWAILAKHFVWNEMQSMWDADEAVTKRIETSRQLQSPNRKTKGFEQKIENFEWRDKALTEKLHPEELTIVLQEINGEISASSGYLGAISDRSKNLYFHHLTVGQALMQSLEKNPHESLKNKVYYRQDYLDEFETIWEKQAQFHSELTKELKQEIRDVVIFYQRRLRSQKSLISICEFERKEVTIEQNNQSKTITIGSRVIPRSSPLFQEFKVWQILNNLEIQRSNGSVRKRRCDANTNESLSPEEMLEIYGHRPLTPDEKQQIAEELSVRENMKATQVLKLLLRDTSEWTLNYDTIEGNITAHRLYKAFSDMMELSGHLPIDFKQPAQTIKKQTFEVFKLLNWNTQMLTFDSDIHPDKQDYYQLWHLLYSFEGDNTITGHGKLIKKLAEFGNFEQEYLQPLVNISFTDDYGSLSAKAIRKILPYMKEGNRYDIACELAGYRHSATSITKEEIQNKVLCEKLELLPKGSLRNPVVEKILNQMVNVVNEIIHIYGRPDEIRVELARELKKNQKEREVLSKMIADSTKEQEHIRKKLIEDFNIAHPTRNDIIRYRLYEELKENGYKTLYSNTYIPQEKLFSKDFDIEHIIPKARLFDDSYSNKTLELRSVNIEKGNKTAYDFVLEKYGDDGLQRYLKVCDSLFFKQKTKLRKLKWREEDIPDNFIERDLRNTQYIAKKALSMLHSVCRSVVATTGAITDQLRNDWQLVDIMKELNWNKYAAVGNVEYYTNHDGHRIGQIKDWTKRNDHRHHAMDALTVAFTKRAYIQYFNHKNAAERPDSIEHALKNSYFSNGKAIAPIPLNEFRAEAKQHLENILVSVKAKNKVITQNINKTKAGKRGTISKVQQTPRGQLHLETIYGSRKEYETKYEKVNASFDEAKIMTVCCAAWREALLWRLHQSGNDAKKAFTGKNALDKNPIWLNDEHTQAVPVKVKTIAMVTNYTIRKPIDKDLKIDKVVDVGIRRILQQRLAAFGGDAAKAFGNLDENPIWLNQEKGISIKRVAIYGISNPIAIHDKRDKDGNFMLDANGQRIPVDFVNTSNNHHVAIFRKPVLDKKGLPAFDEKGLPLYELDEHVVSFYKAVARMNQKLPAVDKYYHQSEGWEFLYTMKQNEYFVFPDEATGFNPHDIDLMNPENYAIISPHLFRVQKLSTKNYFFRHHLETTVETPIELSGITYKSQLGLKGIKGIVKVRINHIGQIVAVGEY